MPFFVYPLLSVIGVSLLSLLGIIFFLFEGQFIRKILLYVVSFSTGGLLGDVFIHMLPEMAKQPSAFGNDLLIVLVGILFSFVVEKIIHWRHCHLLPTDEEEKEHHHSVGFMSLMGESMHNFIDGIVIGASFVASVPVGISTTLAVAFHEIPHEIGNFAVLLHSGFPRKRALLLNLLSAGVAIIGTVIVIVTSISAASVSEFMLPFAAGNLLYIAGSDLIPELHRETGLRQGAVQLFCMIAGIGVMYLLLALE